MTLFKLVLVLSALTLFGSAYSNAETFRLIRDSDGSQFFCSQNGTPGPDPIDPNCTQQVSDYCNQNTNNTRDACFSKATTSCRGSAPGFSACVKTSADYCNKNTNNTRDRCFELALGSCKGSADVMSQMLESVHQSALLQGIGLRVR